MPKKHSGKPVSTTLDYIAKKFNLDLNRKSPIEILDINRVIMAQTLNELGFKVGAEIGVAQGDHAKTLCENNPDLKLYCIDPWQYYHGYTDFMGKKLERFYKEATEKLVPYNCILIRKFSMDAVKDFEDGSLDFVYIDSNHDFQHVTNDIVEWEKKVRPDGIVFGHDYKRDTDPKVKMHVVDVVNSYTYAMRIKPWFILGTRGERDGTPYREDTRSWMWVRS